MAANEPLRKAMADARITIETLGRAVSVHPKTVQRWLAGRVPHPRHRWAIADLLGIREEALWPNLKAGGSQLHDRHQRDPRRLRPPSRRPLPRLARPLRPGQDPDRSLGLRHALPTR